MFVPLVIPALYNYVSYAAGLTALPFLQYVAVTALGGIIPTSFVVAIGAGLAADRRLLAVVYGVLAAVAVLALLTRRYILRATGAGTGAEALPGIPRDGER